MIMRGADISQSLTRKQWKDISNPNIYENLIQSLDIDEKGTNFLPQLHNSSNPESFYDHLAKLQQEEMDKLEKQQNNRKKDKGGVGNCNKESC